MNDCEQKNVEVSFRFVDVDNVPLDESAALLTNKHYSLVFWISMIDEESSCFGKHLVVSVSCPNRLIEICQRKQTLVAISGDPTTENPENLAKFDFIKRSGVANRCQDFFYVEVHDGQKLLTRVAIERDFA